MVHYSFCDLERYMTFKFNTVQPINFMKNKYFDWSLASQLAQKERE